MKYIPADELIAEIEGLKEKAQAERVLHPQTILSAKNYLLIKDYDTLLSIIASLQQEQPEEALSKPELPSNLDEAAEKWVENNCFDCDCVGENRAWDAFKAGAEWMTGQGYIKEGIARPDDDEIWVNMTNTDIKDGDKVVVQIRKK